MPKPLKLTILTLLTLTPILPAEEFMTQTITGNSKQHVAQTNYFFQGENCHAAKRSYWNRQMHVIRPKISWDLFYANKRIATLDPEARSIAYIRVPQGMTFRKNLNTLTLQTDTKILRVWKLENNQITLLPQTKLGQLTKKLNSPNATITFPPIQNAPTKKEALTKMKQITR